MILQQDRASCSVTNEISRQAKFFMPSVLTRANKLKFNFGILPAIVIKHSRHLQSPVEMIHFSFKATTFTNVENDKKRSWFTWIDVPSKISFLDCNKMSRYPHLLQLLLLICQWSLNWHSEARGICYLCVQFELRKQLHTTSYKILHSTKVHVHEVTNCCFGRVNARMNFSQRYAMSFKAWIVDHWNNNATKLNFFFLYDNSCFGVYRLQKNSTPATK